MTRRETESDIIYRGDAYYAQLPKPAGYHTRRTSGRAAAFWLDWAPMLLLGLTVTLAGLFSIGSSLDRAHPAPVIVQTEQQAPPAANRPIQSAAPNADRNLPS